jgi:hypothetical protein
MAENMGNGFEAYMGGVDDYTTGAAAYAAYDNAALGDSEASMYGKGGHQSGCWVACFAF